MEINLIVLEGKHRGEKITLPSTQFVIGRDGSCHLRPVSTAVSKFHCAIARMGNRVLLRDLKSTNGTFLNDQRISGTARLGDGDILRVGPLKFLLQVVQHPSSPPSDDNMKWLLRSPDEKEKKVLDLSSDTSIFRGLSPVLGEESPSTPPPHSSAHDEATAVAGRFLQDYLNKRKGPEKKDAPPAAS